MVVLSRIWQEDSANVQFPTKKKSPIPRTAIPLLTIIQMFTGGISVKTHRVYKQDVSCFIDSPLDAAGHCAVDRVRH